MCICSMVKVQQQGFLLPLVLCLILLQLVPGTVVPPLSNSSLYHQVLFLRPTTMTTTTTTTRTEDNDHHRHHHNHHQRQLTSYNEIIKEKINSEMDDVTSPFTKHIPMSLIVQLKDISNVDELFEKVIEPGQRYKRRGLKSATKLVKTSNPKDLEDDDSEDEEDGGGGGGTDTPLEIGPIFDKRAFCHPRRQPVNVPQPEDPTLIYQPMCIQVERCGGCCAHELFECVPSIVKNATRKVVALRYPHSGAEYFVFEAVAKVRIERHTKCKCQCKTQPEHCSANQVYDRQNCQCVCEQQNGHLKCKEPQVWNSKECRCRCQEFSECSTGTYFDTRMCRCRAAGEILAQSKLFKSQLRRLYH